MINQKLICTFLSIGYLNLMGGKSLGSIALTEQDPDLGKFIKRTIRLGAISLLMHKIIHAKDIIFFRGDYLIFVGHVHQLNPNCRILCLVTKNGRYTVLVKNHRCLKINNLSAEY